MTRRRELLVVDDDVDVLEALVTDLDEHYVVTAASDGKQALSMLGERQFDVLVTDIRMPGMDGIELATAARKIDPSMPNVFVSAYSDPQSTDVILDTPGAFKINKPWRDTLNVAVERALEFRQHHLRQQQADPAMGLASARMALLGLRAAGMVHDIRNFLLVLETNLDVLRSTLNFAADTVVNIAQAPTFAGRALEEVAELLRGDDGLYAVDDSLEAFNSIAGIVSSSIALVRGGEEKGAECDVKMAVERACSDMARRFQKPIQFAVGAGLLARIPEFDLVRVLVNLLQNAAAATDSTGTVQIRVSTTAETILIDVEDDGPGMDPDFFTQIGTSFSADTSGRIGLGLAVSADILRQSGGALSYDQLGTGSIFRIEVPRCAVAAA